MLYKDRVRETTSSTGTGTLTLDGAAGGSYQSFDVYGVEQFEYAIIDNVNGDWEVGIGTYDTDVLTRVLVQASSNEGAAVDFGAGVKDVFSSISAANLPSTAKDNTFEGRDKFKSTTGTWEAATEAATFTIDALEQAQTLDLTANITFDSVINAQTNDLQVVLITVTETVGSLTMAFNTANFSAPDKTYPELSGVSGTVSVLQFMLMPDGKWCVTLYNDIGVPA